jgi:rubrerythrin
MSENKVLDIIKGAILLEHRGKSLYDSVVQSSQSSVVRELFQFLSEEEEKHIAILEKQYKKVTNNQAFSLDESLSMDFKTSRMVLNNKIVEEISGAGYEAAVVAAALGFEKNAVAYYSNHATNAETAGEKKLYEWLSEWEKSHMNLLAELDKELKERIWYDNSFWPM